VGDGGADTSVFTFSSGATTPEFNGNAMWHTGNLTPVEDLPDLGDVAITTPLDGDVLTYDSGTSKWINAAPVGGISDAEDVTYDNTASGLAATDVQAAIDEVVSILPSGTPFTLDDFTTYWLARFGLFIVPSNNGRTASVINAGGIAPPQGNTNSIAFRNSGKIYFEVFVDLLSSGPQTSIGVTNQNTPSSAGFAGAPSTGANSSFWTWSGTGSYWAPSASGSGLPTFATNDVLGFALDLTPASGSRLMWVSKNGTFTGNPSAGTGATFTNLKDVVAPCATVAGAGGPATVTLRMKAGEFTYSPPSGFSAWSI